MSFEEFKRSPWARSHDAFEESTFNIRPAPEFSTGEVVLSSLYRASGYSGVAEKSVVSAGRDLDKAASSQRSRGGGQDRIRQDTWRTILDRVIQSPKASQQSRKRFLSLSPVVPDVALYSGAARLAGNPWNPGQLIARMIRIGASSDAAAEAAWGELHASLSIGDDDDVWARWLQSEFQFRRTHRFDWKATTLAGFESMPPADRTAFQYPARQFVTDLKGMVDAKGAMTRRQWTSLLESILRIGTVSHVLWLCDVNDKLWRAAAAILGHGSAAIPATRDDAIRDVLAVRRQMLSYGNPANPVMRDAASRYLTARLGLNSLLWALEEIGVRIDRLKSVGDLLAFLAGVRENSETLRSMNMLERFYALQDQEVRTVNCKKGIGSNLFEFCQYTLGQRQTLDATLRGYDQGYYLRKRGAAANSPWVLAPGPAAVLALAHCCLHEVNGPRSVQRLADHMAAYGIACEVHGLNDSDLGRQLRMLGLVLDSPDAESGMLLVPPFAVKEGST